MNKLAFTLIAACTINTAQAQVYQCTVNGSTVFSDRPCQQGDINADAERARQIREEKRAAEQAKVDAKNAKQHQLQLVNRQREDDLIQKSIQAEKELKKWHQVGIKAEVSNSPYDGSVMQVERYLKRSLNDPDSYKHEKCGPVWSNGSQYRVWCEFKAKNAFGGYVRTNKVFVLSGSGTVLRTANYNGKHVAFY